MESTERPPGPADTAEEELTQPAASDSALVMAPEVVTDTLGEYTRARIARIRAGETGVLAVVVGLVVIAVLFQVLNDNFLSPGNLTNLLVQGAAFMILGMAEIFALLLGEIDLSIGFVRASAGSS